MKMEEIKEEYEYDEGGTHYLFVKAGDVVIEAIDSEYGKCEEILGREADFIGERLAVWLLSPKEVIKVQNREKI